MDGTVKVGQFTNKTKDKVTSIYFDVIQWGISISIDRERWNCSAKPAHKLAITNEDIPKSIKVESNYIVPNKENGYSRAILSKESNKLKKIPGADVKNNAYRVDDIFKTKDRDEK